MTFFYIWRHHIVTFKLSYCIFTNSIVQMESTTAIHTKYYSWQTTYSYYLNTNEHCIWKEEGGTCRTLAPTLFLKAYNLCVRAKAVPCCAVVDGLKVGWDDVAHGKCWNDSLLCVDSLHSVAARGSRLQNSFLPWPGLIK